MVEQGKSFVVDFRDCTSMDSTFLGILVGLALELRKHKEKGQHISKLDGKESRNGSKFRNS